MLCWRKMVVFLVVFMGLSSSAWAKEKSFVNRGPYAYLKGGVFLPNDRQNTDSDNDMGLDGFGTGPNIEGGIGSRGYYLGVEMGLGYYDTSFSEGTMQIDVNAIPLSFSLLAIYPTEIADFYIGAGPGVYFSDGSVKVAGQKISSSDVSFGYHVLGGIDFNMSRDFALGADVKWFRSEAEYSKSGLNLPDVDIGGIAVRLGLKYRFR